MGGSFSWKGRAGGGVLQSFTAHPPEAPAPRLPFAAAIARRGASLPPGLRGSARRPSPSGPRLCPTCWGRRWSPDGADKCRASEGKVVLSAFLWGVRSGFQLCLCGIGRRVSPACVSFLKIRGWVKVYFCPFLFIVDLVVKGMVVFIERL